MVEQDPIARDSGEDEEEEIREERERNSHCGALKIMKKMRTKLQISEVETHFRNRLGRLLQISG